MNNKNQFKRVGIIGAMDIELEILKNNLNPLQGESKVKKTQGGGLCFYSGLLNGVEVVIVKSGVGKVNAALCVQRLVLEYKVTHIINTGIAGAMAAGLKVLDFVVSTDALYHDMDASGFGYELTQIPQMECSDFKADDKMLDAATITFAQMAEAEGHEMVAGRIASGDQFISSREVKDKIKKICNPACVEMEGAAIAHASYVNKVPFLIIRCMSDMADDGHEEVYKFNEKTAADLSAALVMNMIDKF